MKKILLSSCFLMVFTLLGLAQIPQLINYQGVARNAMGNPLINQSIGLRINILDNTTSVYTETHAITTNAFGLFNVKIGGGTIAAGVFNNIAWSTGNKFVKIEIDPMGGNAYTLLGNTELLSVPYALYAASGNQGPQGLQGIQGVQGIAGPQGIQGVTGNAGIQGATGATGATGPVNTLSIGSVTNGTTATATITGTAPNQTLNLTIPQGLTGATGAQGQPGAMGAMGATGPMGTVNFQSIVVGDMTVIYTANSAHGFSQAQSAPSPSAGYPNDNIGSWNSTTLVDTVIGVQAAENLIVLYTATAAYAFGQAQSAFSTQTYPHKNTGVWVSTSIVGNVIGAVSSKDKVVVYTDVAAYGVCQGQSPSSLAAGLPNANSPVWIGTTLTSTPIFAIANSKSICIGTNNAAHSFSQGQSAFSTQINPHKNIGVWTSTTLGTAPKGVVTTK